MDITLIYALIIIAFLVYLSLSSYSETEYIESSIDKHHYLIRRGKTKSDAFLKDSADALAEINTRILTLIQHLEKNYAQDPSKNYFITKLKENYHSYVLSEAAIDNRYTTYTVDKENIHVCLRTRDNQEKLYDINILMYVMLHELAHMCNYDRYGNPIEGHGSEFKNIFKFLVIEAVKIGIYQYQDYSKKPVEYCNLMINSTIVSEESLQNYM